jgi:hypothetical protein
VCAATADQLNAAADALQQVTPHDSTHAAGMRALVAGPKVAPDTVTAMLRDDDPLARRYGAILVRRLGPVSETLDEEIGLTDPELREFLAGRTP